jgi:drug/metabolite transporter (DMT)-like permease
MPLNAYEGTVLGSEVVLSLYPILIKTIKTNLPTQILSRLLTFSGGGLALSSREDIVNTLGTPAAIQRTLALGLLTVSHIYVSYLAFSSLSAGVAMSLFYTYPFWNLLGGAVVYGEPVNTGTIPYLISGLVGTYIMSSSGQEDSVGGLGEGKVSTALGVAAALGAALTESAMYFAVKDRKSERPWASMVELYGGALPWLLCALPFVKFQFSLQAWIPMLLFNVIVGFIGYALRFFSIPKVSTEIFGLLSFVGVLSSFVFGYLFVGEKPSILTLVGAICILVAVSHIESIRPSETSS